MLASAIAEFTLQDLLSPELLENPYPAFSSLRAESPIHREPDSHRWVLSRYEHIAAAFADRRLSNQTFVSAKDKARGSLHPVLTGISRQMLFQDPPHHTRLRSLMVKAFTPQRVESLRPAMTRITNHLLDEAERNGGCIDFMESVAGPLPVNAIANMLGVPEEDHLQLQEWSFSFGNLINGCELTSEQRQDAYDGIYAIIRYLTRLITEKRRRPSKDMLSDLIAVEQNGDSLDMEELMMNVILLFFAGHGTTTHLLGNSLLALLHHPSEFELLSANPSIAPLAVQEFVRFNGPIQMAPRIALQDIWIEDNLIRQGDEIDLIISSANRDETVFPDPDRLDLRRTSNKRSLSFGYGMHACIGRALALLETEVLMTEIARRFPRTWLEETPQYLRSLVFRGLETLPVVLA